MKTSAGILLYRRAPTHLEVLLVHPGGPIWAKREEGAWSIPKGEASEGEDLLDAARREFEEELGSPPPGGPYVALGSITQKGGKVVHAWAVEGTIDTAVIKSNTFSMEWPPRSGRQQEFPEIDKAAFFPLEEASGKLNPAQVPFLHEVEQLSG
jgi:predicted NUDIX family NTP pyrophosphohydrolase